MDWGPYIQKTRGGKPRPLLLEALPYCVRKETALDLGAGAMNEARYLAAQGFKVTAVDSSFDAAEELGENIDIVVSSMEGYEYPADAYDLVSAFYSLPFVKRERLPEVIAGIKLALRENGIFAGEFFGPEDGWAASPDVAVYSKEEVKAMLAPLEVLKIEEEKQEGKTALEGDKQWHVFHIIARKR
jgi:tellurite methyltransferase